MKNNQKKRANGGAQLSKKQRKAQAKKALTAPVRPKMPRETKWMIALVAGICVLAIVCATFGGILLSRALTDPYLNAYDKLNINEYLATDRMGKLFYTSNTLDFSVEEVTKYAAKDDAYMDEYIEAVRLNHRKLVKEGQRSTPIGLADSVLIYVTGIYKGDTAAKENLLTPTSDMEALFGTYSSPVSFIVGNEYFGEDFDNKIQGIVPADTGRIVRNNGTFSLTDNVCISYYFFKSTGASATPDAEKIEDRYQWGSVDKTYSKQGVRVTPTDLEAVLANALVDNCLALGEEYSFVLENYNMTGNASDKNAVYKVIATAHYVIEEEYTKDITFTVPENYFGQNDGDAFYALNGKEMTVRLIVVATDDYELPEFNREFITETLKMEVTATDDAGAVAEYRAKRLADINKSLAEQMHEAKLSVAYATLAAKATNANLYSITDYGTTLKNEVYVMVIEELESAFIENYGYLPTSDALDAYAVYLASSAGQELSGYQEYASYVIQSSASTIISQELIMHYVFEKAGLKITDEALEKAINDRIDEIYGWITDKEDVTREDVAAYYGDTALGKQVRRDLMYHMVGEFLLENNTVAN